MRGAAVLLVAAAAGCAGRTEEPQPGAAPRGPDLDFAGWPAATPRAVPVEATFWAFCRPVPQAELDAERGRHGPHFRPAILVRVSPAALDDFKAGRPLPVGAAVVKEKHPDPAASAPPEEYAAMVKREAGYFPAGGDWEYLHVVARPERKEARGRLAACAECHRQAAGSDYLFRTYRKADH